MHTIKNIYRVNFMRDQFSYIGTLRNQYKFDINDKVFFTVNNHDIYYGRIVGVELPPDENPEYRYKIALPEELIRERMDNKKFYAGEDIDKVVLTCKSIFTTTQQAKEAAIKNLDNTYELQKDEIERYFSKFEK
jgi:hypothetical protein